MHYLSGLKARDEYYYRQRRVGYRYLWLKGVPSGTLQVRKSYSCEYQKLYPILKQTNPVNQPKGTSRNHIKLNHTVCCAVVVLNLFSFFCQSYAVRLLFTESSKYQYLYRTRKSGREASTSEIACWSTNPDNLNYKRLKYNRNWLTIGNVSNYPDPLSMTH